MPEISFEACTALSHCSLTAMLDCIEQRTVKGNPDKMKMPLVDGWDDLALDVPPLLDEVSLLK